MDLVAGYELPHVVVLGDGWLLDATFGFQVSARDARLVDETGPLIVRAAALPARIRRGAFTFEWTPRAELVPALVACVESIPGEWLARARAVAAARTK